jgi:hypothetical protein
MIKLTPADLDCFLRTKILAEEAMTVEPLKKEERYGKNTSAGPWGWHDDVSTHPVKTTVCGVEAFGLRSA